MIRLKRIYDEIGEDDGARVLVDRLWPRGVAKDDAGLDEWCKDITPSDELRKWFHEDQDERWSEFRRKYRAELDDADEAAEKLDWLVDRASESGLTLLTAARNPERSHAAELKSLIEQRAGKGKGS